MRTQTLRLGRRSAATAFSTAKTHGDERFRLNRSETFSLDGDYRGRRISCLAGVIWITQTGDAMDYRLNAGECLTIARRGRVVVQGLAASDVEMR